VRRIRIALGAILISVVIAGCRYFVPAGGSDDPLGSANPLPGGSAAPRVSPSLEIPPPRD
jgi:hypothetical protein